MSRMGVAGKMLLSWSGSQSALFIFILNIRAVTPRVQWVFGSVIL